jgi:(p)ppGpp synthase/HD superfamily hydrolase
VTYSRRFDAAVALAVEAFRSTCRKGGEIPYITHLFAVTARVGEAGGDEDQMIAAILHDYLEDIEGASSETLEAQFGVRVRRMVEALSDSRTFPKPHWRSRKETYLQGLRSEQSDVKLISCADKLHNITSVIRDLEAEGRSTFERFNGKEKGTLWYYRGVVEALGQGWDHPMLEELKGLVAQLHLAVAELPEGSSA